MFILTGNTLQSKTTFSVVYVFLILIGIVKFFLSNFVDKVAVHTLIA